MNIIELLGITYKEDIISNLIVGLINESNNFKIRFLENIIGISNANLYTVEAFTRISTAQGIPDIIIKIYNEQENTLAIIENKLKAEEGYIQTARYSTDECIKEICLNNKIKLDYNNMSKKFIYLTLIPEQIPSGGNFVNKTYRALLDLINVEIENEILNHIYQDFMKLIKDFYCNLDVNKNDKILDLLCDNIDSEKIYIKFKNIMKLCNFDNGLEVKYVGKTGGIGRISFIAQISKDNWISNSKASFIDGLYSVNDDTYNIHLEFSFDILNKLIKLPLHYETNPYIPKSKLIKNSKVEDYNNYIDRRDVVKKKLHEEIILLGDKDIKPYNGSNQIANINIYIDNNLTVKEFIENVEQYCNKISVLVDRVLSYVY